MESILMSVMVLGGLGLLFGIVLAFAAKKFHVHIDPRVEEIMRKLPGANCGACGQAGCNAFANSLVKSQCTLSSCPVTGDNERESINKILGVEAEAKIKRAAVLHCNGGDKVKSKFNYQGVETCHAANLVFGGPKACSWGCLGYADCKAACPFGAITMQDGLPVVDIQKCTSCGKCVEACPKKLFSIQSIQKNVHPVRKNTFSNGVHVRCKSQDIGKNTMAACSVGCIGCMLCEKKCAFDAIHVINNIAVIDYEKCTACGECILVCPKKTIARSSEDATYGTK